MRKEKSFTDEKEENLRPVKPFIPYYAQPGCTIIRTWEEDFVDRLNNRAVVTKCEYSDKKGKIHEFVKLVKWLKI